MDPQNLPEEFFLPIRARRNRQSASLRSLIRETTLRPSDFILPLFVMDGKNSRDAIASMPGQYRYTADLVLKKAAEAHKSGIPAVALFPKIPESKKNPTADESKNPSGLLQNTIRLLKDKIPELTIISDVAMDPYSSHGHDGLVENGKIVNDKTLEILGAMAVNQARAGADMVAPSDMMDGRVGYLRDLLDDEGFTETGILAYSAKYASSFYGPFRDALGSAPKKSKNIPADKKTYQMDPGNSREALREIFLDIDEGADMVMVKPALPYLDVITKIKSQIYVPLAAYQVSGEYAMLHAAAEKGWLDLNSCMLESLLAIKRAGADCILSYFSLEAAKLLG